MQEQKTSRSGMIKQYIARKAKRTLIAAAFAIPLALGFRAAVAEAFYATSNAVAPEVPQNSRVLVYKLASAFKADDIIVYRDAAGRAMFGRVVTADATFVTVARSGEPQSSVPLRQVVGRVVLSTR